MGHRSTAIIWVFLLLSAAPIDAGRIHESGASFIKAKHSLGGAAHADTEFGATCETLHRRFNTRSSNGVSSVQRIRESSGTAGFTTVSQSLFSMWSMVRIVRHAQSKQCAWAANVDVAPLQQIMTETLSGSACLSLVEDRLEDSQNATQEEQADVFLTSMGMLMTGDCRAQPMTEEPENNDLDEPQSTDDASEHVDDLVDQLMEVNLEEEAAAALLQMQGNQPAGGTQVAETAIRWWPPPAWRGVDRWRTVTPSVSIGGQEIVSQGVTYTELSAGPQTAQQWVLHGLGVAAWLIGFALVCTTAVYLFALIVGALLCLLRSILLLLLGQTTTLRTCLNRVVATVQRQQTLVGMVGGLCLAGGAALITTTGGVVGTTMIR
jgi:hypothetical protein